MSALSEELVRITEQGRSAVLATIVEAQGSDRVQAGAKCLVVDGKAKS
jgi:xanthine/CO dehydrogenase XdhC/CoxF family maturation factor